MRSHTGTPLKCHLTAAVSSRFDTLMAADLADRVVFPGSGYYEPALQSWWALNSRLRPWCLVLPQPPGEVSTVVKALVDSGLGAGDWNIALRGGGHGHPYLSNTANGVTIDLSMMNNSWYNASTGLASVESGAAWGDVYYKLLNNGNVTVTGGRDGNVGVGGYTLGGGPTYYTSAYGLTCDTVANYEVVLANGSIVQANSNSNADLWRALKGGGTNFGIVTRFDMVAQPAVNIALRQNVVVTDHSDQAIEVVMDFVDNLQNTRDDALYTAYTHNLVKEGLAALLMVGTNIKGNTNSSTFDKLNALPALSRSWTAPFLADAANTSRAPGGKLTYGTALTFSNVQQVLQAQASLYAEFVQTLSASIGAGNFSTAFFVQAFPTYYNTLGVDKTENMLGIGRLKKNAINWTGGVFVNGNETAGLSHTNNCALRPRSSDK